MQPTFQSNYCVVQPSQVDETVRHLTANGFGLFIHTPLSDGLVRIDAVRKRQLSDNLQSLPRTQSFYIPKDEEDEWKKKNNIFNC